MNLEGGKWVFRIRRQFKSQPDRGRARRYWELLVLGLVGGELAEKSGVERSELVGAVISVRRDEDIFSLWTRGPAQESIRDAMRTVLDVPEEVGFEFKVHTESIREGEQKQAFYNANSASANASTTSLASILGPVEGSLNQHQNLNNHWASRSTFESPVSTTSSPALKPFSTTSIDTLKSPTSKIW